MGPALSQDERTEGARGGDDEGRKPPAAGSHQARRDDHAFGGDKENEEVKKCERTDRGQIPRSIGVISQAL